MDVRWVTNDLDQKATFFQTIDAALVDASAVDIAVSYVAVSGWELLKRPLGRLDNVRMLITSQFSITQPEALRRAIAARVRVRNYDGDRVYHPKMYLVYGSNGNPNVAILGSANLSESALTTAVEAGISTTNRTLLKQLQSWFQELFEDQDHCRDVDDTALKELERSWARAAARRILAQASATPPTQRAQKSVLPPENIDVLEDLFATIRAPIGILSFDHAGNNVRNLLRALEVLHRYPRLTEKEKSELHLLAFLSDEGRLTKLGETARRCTTEQSLATVWCRWVAAQAESDLQRRNSRLASFKRAATQFWRLTPEIRTFFFENLGSVRQRPLLQTIELFCNGSSVVSRISLDQLRSLAPIVTAPKGLTKFLEDCVREYHRNKGSRSWASKDRLTMLTAWRNVTRRSSSEV
jgi:HKD family nuclease